MSTDVAGLLESMQEAARQLAALEQHAAEMGRLANEQGLRAERLVAALRAIADYTQDGVNGECCLCYFKIEGLTTHKEECPWPSAVSSMRTEGTMMVIEPEDK